MQSIQTRTYTNVMLTAIAMLLLALLASPYMRPNVVAADADLANTREVEAAQIQAAATREVATATANIASSIKESAKAQETIAAALDKFSESMKGGPTTEAPAAPAAQ